MAFSLNQYFTIDASVLQHAGIAGNNVPDKKIKLNIFLEAESLLSPGLLKRIISLENEFIYSLPASMFIENVSLDKYLPALYLLMSACAGVKANEKIIPLIVDDGNQAESIVTAALTTFFNSQGIEKIAFPYFKTGTGNGHQTADSCTYIFCDRGFEENIASIFAVGNLQSGSDIFKPTIILFEENITSADRFYEVTSKILLFQRNQLGSVIWEGLIEGNAEARDLKVDLGLWQKRALLYNDFLTLSKSVQEREYFEVLNWYHAEYESLPLWYKRVGHIIKVFKGKRTFLSLFSNNVKKHKH